MARALSVLGSEPNEIKRRDLLGGLIHELRKGSLSPTDGGSSGRRDQPHRRIPD